MLRVTCYWEVGGAGVAMVEHEPFKLTPFETPRILERIRIKPEYSASNTTDEEVEE